MFGPRTQKRAPLEVRQVVRQARLKKGSRVLDLCCGTGRHSLHFARAGLDVTGLDFQPTYVEEARRRVRSATFVRGDMRALSKHFTRESFDAVVCLFNSFGYFDRKHDDLRVLREIARVLKPGGAFVLNVLNGPGAEKATIKGKRIGTEIKRNLFLIEEVRFDSKRRRTKAQWTWIDVRNTRSAKVSRKSFEQTVYSHADYVRMLKPLGLRIEKVWGTLSGGRFDSASSWHQTFVARKQ